jgi:RHS repeat-associated protein
LIDDSGDVFERYRYSPYGEVTVLDPDFSPDANNSSDVSNPYTYTGRRLDFESGLYCFRNRYYSAQLGRFVSRDPIGYTGGGANLYEYVGGSPAGSVDPLGLQPGIGNLKPQDRFIGNILRSFEKFHYDYVPSSRGPTYSWGSPEKNDDFTCYATFTYFEMETRLTKDTMFNVFATADPEKLAALRNKMRQLFQQMTRLTKHRNDARSLARTLGNTSDALLVVATISFIFSFTGNPVAAGIGVSALVHGEALAIASSNQDALADRLDARIWDLNNDFRDIQMQLATGQGLMDKQYEVKVGDFNKEESQAVWTKVTKTRVIPVSPLYCVCPEIAVDAFGVPPAPKIPSRETEWMEIEPGLFIASCVVRKRVLAVV